jgi:Skp family chaperone for outer membrane proteins
MGTPEDNSATLVNDNNSQSTNGDTQPTVDWEKRFKDTQAAFTKSQQELKAKEAKLAALEEITTPRVELDAATKERLEDLKFSDPDAWRAEVNRLEAEANKAHRERLASVEAEATKQAELERRASVLASFNSYSDVKITDETIAYDIPARITKRLENGEVSFEQFLEEAASYLKAPKVVGDGNKTLEQPNLSEVGGNHSAAEYTAEPDSVASYRNEIY